MKTEVVPAADPDAVRHAADVLRHGGLVAFPTDTVYGVGAPAFKGELVARLYFIKGRSTEKAIAILIGDSEDLPTVASEVSEDARRLAEAFWPGAITLVVRKQREVPSEVSASETVGVRVPDLAVTRALLRVTGPLAATSANRSGEPSPVTAQEVLAALGDRIDLLIDGGRCPGGLASTVVDCTARPPRILREGPISEDAIRSIISV